jgi:hypothetical protein
MAITHERDDEIGKLLDALSHMTQRLAHTVRACAMARTA